ncbi:acyl carrier protein [Streptomyces kanamyceticus]|uniref:Acyl carrier protein n=1 Tax=Streptomyces kanamyceticus TaxID=1967 RepID=A0A5J6GQC4_STRKN|nr:acyl carrier protein [Streptomyces kanamyceticus]QEU96245.1 acyl carrier protein [Streptomyces kanamyceticus]
MSELTLPELVDIMRECAGEEEAVTAAGADVGDVELENLGYDSLALMEAAGRVKRQYKAELTDDALAEIRTLNQFVAAVNDTLASAGARPSV